MNFGASDPLQDYQIATFGGVDFSTLENKVDMTRSPDAVNMIMNHNGYLEKRTGYRRLYRGEGRINGIFDYTPADAAETFWFLHEGTKLYRIKLEGGTIERCELLLSDLEDKKSRHFVFGGAMYILGCGYIQIRYKKGILEYGHVCRIGTSDAVVDMRDTEELQLISTDAAYRAQYYSYSEVISTKGAELDAPINKNVIEIKTSADSVRIEGIYVQKEETWMPWDLSFAKIEDSGKKITLLGNPVYGGGFNAAYNFTFEGSFKFQNVKIVYSEAPAVAEPLMFIHRSVVPIKRYSDEEGTRDNSEQYWEYDRYSDATYVAAEFVGKLPLDGDMIDSANFAHGRRRVQFTVPEAEEALCGYVAYLTGKEEKATINRIAIDGNIVHSYMDINADRHTNGSGTVGYCYVSAWPAVEMDANGRFVRFHKIAWHKDYNAKEFSRNINTGLLPGSVIEIDFTVLRDEASDDEQISACSIYGIYGGNNDTRVFLAGNPKFKNRDYASALYDATYFPNSMYTDVGSEASAIVGYQKLYSNQIVVKDDATEDASQYLRSLNMDEAGNVTYTLQQGSSTYGASCKSSFKQIGGIPFYIGPGGVYTIAGTTVQNQNNTTLRSLQINKRFLLEDLENAVCCRYDDFYIVACKNHMWLCDTANALEWFFFDGLPEVTCILSHGNRLYFGTADGRVCVFSDREDKDAYYDNVSPDGGLEEASPVQCHWCTPISAFGSWNMLKTVVNVYLSCMPYNESSVHVYYNSSDEIGEDITTESIVLFDFADVNFDSFSFDSIRQPKPFATGVKAKNVYVFGVRLENAEAQPFGIVSVGYKYRFSKYVK